MTLTLTDDEGRSTRLLYTGMSVSCNGSAATRATRARATHAVSVAR